MNESESIRPSEQEPQTPDKAAKGFLDKWGAKIAAVAFIPSTVFTSEQAVNSIAAGDTKMAVLWGIGTAMNVSVVGMNLALDRMRNRRER